jgi:predicted transcriptional regulator
MTLAVLSPERARYVANPAEVERKESELLEALRLRPGASTAALAELTAGNKKTVDARLSRLRARGVIDGVGGRWRLQGDEPSVGDAYATRTERDDRRLLDAIAAHPGRTCKELAVITGTTLGGVAGRASRLGRRGMLQKRADGRWRLAAASGPQGPIELAASQPEPEGELPEISDRRFPPWVRDVNEFVRPSLGDFAPPRYG